MSTTKKETGKKKPIKKATVAKSKTAVKDTKNESKTGNIVSQVQHQASLMALSPFRFPLDTEKLAIQSARLMGVAFVFVGAFLSVFSLPAVESRLSVAPQVASIYTSFGFENPFTRLFDERNSATSSVNNEMRAASSTPDCKMLEEEVKELRARLANIASSSNIMMFEGREISSSSRPMIDDDLYGQNENDFQPCLPPRSNDGVYSPTGFPDEGDTFDDATMPPARMYQGDQNGAGQRMGPSGMPMNSFLQGNGNEESAALVLSDISFNVKTLLAAGLVIVLGLILLLLGMYLRHSRLEKRLKENNIDVMI